MKIKCIITDDEPLAREGLLKYVKEIDFLELTGVAENPVELNKLLQKDPVDLLFLDIHMPLMSGFDFLRIKSDLPMVVITTAFPDYAIEGFQFDVVDYLVKPITFNQFFKAATKARDLQQLRNHKDGNSSNNEREKYFFIKCENKYEKIFADEILFIQAMQNYVIIKTEKSKYMTLLPLKTVEENIEPEHFIKVHKSFIVSIVKIETIQNNEILIKGFKIPISRNFKEHVIERVVKNNLLRK